MWKVPLRGPVPLGEWKHGGRDSGCLVASGIVASSLRRSVRRNNVRDVAVPVPCGLARFRWKARSRALETGNTRVQTVQTRRVAGELDGWWRRVSRWSHPVCGKSAAKLRL